MLGSPVGGLVGGEGEGLAGRVLGLARRQQGVVSRGQLEALGVPEWQVTRLRGALRLVPIHAGVFALGHDSLTQDGRWHAAVLAAGPRGALGHRSAAALHGFMEPAKLVELVVRRSFARPRTGLLIRTTRRLEEPDLATVRGIRATSVTRTLVDLARILSFARLGSAFHEAARLGLLEPEAMADAVGPSPGRKGIGRLRRLVMAWTPRMTRTRSSFEASFLGAGREAGLPLPEVNATIEGLEVDCLWRQARLVVELDGYEHHGDRLAFRRDRRRDARLMAAGYRVLRLAWDEVAGDPSGSAETVARLLRRQPLARGAPA